MPLSKKRDRERKRLAKFQPKVDIFQPKQAWEITNWAEVDIEANPHLKAPIPNCKDGRYRE